MDNIFIFQGESGSAQPQPAGAVATVPYYAQPAPVGMVSRSQVVIPVSGQPPFHAVTRPTIVHSTPVPTQVHWQPAQVQYQEVRPAAFQPVVHYGALPQTSSGGPSQAAYGVPTGSGVHYVRGMKDTQAQGRVPQSYFQYSCVRKGSYCSWNSRKTTTMLLMFGNFSSLIVLYFLLTHVQKIFKSMIHILVHKCHFSSQLK